MYFEVVKNVLDYVIAHHAAATGRPEDAVCADIAAHIDSTSAEHLKDIPAINYSDPLCRLGYLYMHTAANATVFEWIIRQANGLGRWVEVRAGDRLSICSVGGGPGTEMLGLVKFFETASALPRRIDFTVLDAVPQWFETWNLLAREAETYLAARAAALGVSPPVVNPRFVPLDAMDASSFSPYASAFDEVDIVVVNYLLSENKTRLADFHKALMAMVQRSRSTTVFLFLDRQEQKDDGKFQKEVLWVVQNSGLNYLANLTWNRAIDRDERAANLGAYLSKFPRHPRVKFFVETQDRTRLPTAFAIVAQKP